ncbi:MAG: hypothetical protein WBD16_09035 [Pyrinomonadaceae bacterium]
MVLKGELIEGDSPHRVFAGDVARLLDYLKIPSADIVSYSMGGGKCR